MKPSQSGPKAEAPELAEASDDDLMVGFAAGSYPAFEALYNRHRDSVYRYFLRAADSASAADGHQETWARIIANRGKFRPQGRFRAYLFTVAHHVLMDQFRQGKWETGTEVEAVADNSPEAEASALETAARLKALIGALPGPQREAVAMRKEAELTIHEIAQVTGATDEGVKSRLRYAMAKLKRGMQGYE